MSEQMTTGGRIDVIEGARGLLALQVVFWHARYFAGYRGEDGWPDWLPFSLIHGTTAVTTFIIISGFVITGLVLNGQERYGPYLARRFLRLWPVFALTILATALWQMSIGPNPERVRSPHLLWELSMFHGAIPAEWMRPIRLNPPGWSISLEWQFYLIAPFVIAALAMHRALPVWLAAFAIVVAFLGLPNETRGLLGLPELTFRFNSFLGTQLHTFAIGITSYFAFRAGWLPYVFGSPINAIVLAVLALGLGQTPVDQAAYVAWVVILFAVANPNSLIARVLSLRALLWLGTISYTIYISHWLVLSALQHHLLAPLGMQEASGGALALISVPGVLLTIGLSALLYRFVEAPINRYGKQRFGTKQDLPRTGF